MGNSTIGPVANDTHELSAMWVEAANTAARNLGLGRRLDELSAEHWQLVLVNVEAKMRMRGVTMPNRWRETLAQQAGRNTE